MTGAIYRDPTRRTWFFVIDLPAAGGRRRQMWRRGFPTKKAAAEALAVVAAEQARGTFVRPSRVTVHRFLADEWLPAKAAALKPSTAAAYRQMIESYIAPRIGDLPLAKVDGSVLNALYADLLANGRTGASGRIGGLSPKTVRNVHGVLHRAFKDAVRWRRLAVNPCDAADQPRRAGPEMRVWTPSELGRFIAATEHDRLGAVWRLLATTGLRRGELAGLRWSDVDLSAGRLTIRQTMTMVDGRPQVGTPKSTAGARSVALDASTVAALRAWKRRQAEERLAMGAGWQDSAGLVVTEPDGSPVHPQVLSRRFTATSKRAGLPAIRLHDVRHSYATAALGAGVGVKVLSQRLGHADVGVTLRVYAHVLPGDDEAAAETVAAVLSGENC
jgi:integrase